jgi:hypothetical protein
MGGLFSEPFGEGGFAEQVVPLWFQANFAKQRTKPDEDRICDQPNNIGVNVDISLMGLFGPWQYKPPQPKKTAQPILDDRARRKRLRRAWRASQSPPDPAK